MNFFISNPSNKFLRVWSYFNPLYWSVGLLSTDVEEALQYRFVT
jgi:hypothetical protein